MMNRKVINRTLTPAGVVILVASGLLASGLSAQTITSVQNPASNILAGLPNYGIAEGSIFVIYGSGLGPTTIDVAPTLPFGTSLAGTSIKVAAGGQSYSAFMVYTLNSQIAAVMPSNVPAGSATVQVTYNGTPGAAFTTTIVTSNFGISTVNQTGTGAAVITTGSYALITQTNSAVPGLTYTMWGTGLGPDAAADNNVAPGAIATPVQVWVGGVQANVSYSGRSSGVGLDQINFTVPSGLSGCNVSLVVQTNAVVSNITTIPVAANGGACSDPQNPTTAAINSALANGSASIGEIFLEQLNLNLSLDGFTSASASAVAGAAFESYTPTQYSYVGPSASNPATTASYGSCTVVSTVASLTSTGGSSTALPASLLPTGLDAGSITLTPPSGASVKFTEPATGSYEATLSSLSAGSYTITGSGGANVGAFTTSLAVPAPIAWTNQSAVAAGPIVRSQGQEITWSGGAANSYTAISGASVVIGALTEITVTFYCTAQTSAGQFTIPPSVLLALPVSSTSSTAINFLSVGSTTNLATFTAPGINAGYIFAASVNETTVTYQ
jgi:uncharacterized protein (TIGR03437 family)